RLDHGAVGYPQDQVGPVRPVPVVAGPGLAVLRLYSRVVMEVEQGMDARIDHEPDAAAATTVATVRATQRLELLSKYGHAPIAAIPGLGMKHDPVDVARHGRPPRRSRAQRSG